MKVDRELGHGGMGTVLAATHAPSGQRFALKFLHEDMLSHPVISQRFAREVELATKLTSAHVARTFAFHRTPAGVPFMVMELLEGQDLCSLLRHERTLAPARAARLVAQACEALEEAHAHGIVHRDLKPENLFVTRGVDGSEWVKVLDFGISKLTEPEGGGPPTPKLTRVGTTVGTPEYMAPEQLRAVADLDGRADVWSLGCVLYELLTGRRAFGGASHDELVRRICNESPTPIRSIVAEVPEPLAALVSQTLERDRRRRIESARALRLALLPFAQARRAEGTVLMEATPISADRISQRPSAHPARHSATPHPINLPASVRGPHTDGKRVGARAGSGRTRAALIAGAALVVVGIALAAWFFFSG
jgi:serine/threonine-protein kinase